MKAPKASFKRLTLGVHIEVLTHGHYTCLYMYGLRLCKSILCEAVRQTGPKMQNFLEDVHILAVYSTTKHLCSSIIQIHLPGIIANILKQSMTQEQSMPGISETMATHHDTNHESARRKGIWTTRPYQPYQPSESPSQNRPTKNASLSHCFSTKKKCLRVDPAPFLPYLCPRNLRWPGSKRSMSSYLKQCAAG